MKLTELNPKWIGPAWGQHGDPGLPAGIISGIRFDCPHCRVQRLAVMFEPPIDPTNYLKIPLGKLDGVNVWHREGDTFETLSLSPSIDTVGAVHTEGHWHGFITNGEVQ